MKYDYKGFIFELDDDNTIHIYIADKYIDYINKLIKIDRVEFESECERWYSSNGKLYK